MNEHIRCEVCNNIIPQESNICPFCGNEIQKTYQNNETLNKTLNETPNKTNLNTELTINQNFPPKPPNFFDISFSLIKKNFSTFLVFSFITVIIELISLPLLAFALFSNIYSNTREPITILSIFLLLTGAFLLLIGTIISLALLTNITYNISLKLFEIKNSIKNNLNYDYKIYKNFSLFNSLVNGITILWYQFLFFIIPIIITIIFSLILETIPLILSLLLLRESSASPMFCFFSFSNIIFNSIISSLITLFFTYLYFSFFIYLTYANINNKSFNLFKGYKFIFNNFIKNNFLKTFLSTIIYSLFSSFLIFLIIFPFVICTLFLGIFFIPLPFLLLNTFFLSYLILNIEYQDVE